MGVYWGWLFTTLLSQLQGWSMHAAESFRPHERMRDQLAELLKKFQLRNNLSIRSSSQGSQRMNARASG
jgi:uncharacterized coiled-coil protein SlyX